MASAYEHLNTRPCDAFLLGPEKLMQPLLHETLRGVACSPFLALLCLFPKICDSMPGGADV